MRSADIAANCREVALRVEISGEWGELGDTLRGAAAEVERLRQQVAMLKPEVTLLGNACEAYTAEICRLRSEIERLRDGVSFQRDDNDLLRTEVKRLRLTPSEQEALIDASLELQSLHCVETDHSATLRNLLARHGGEA